jgi:hypothetical protein
MTAFIIISLIIGVILLCVSVYNAVKYDELFYFITIVVVAGTYLLCSILYFALSYPTDNDVRNGTAEYVKTHHIEVSSNDTIEYDLYRLEWINQ